MTFEGLQGFGESLIEWFRGLIVLTWLFVCFFWWGGGVLGTVSKMVAKNFQATGLLLEL